MFFLIHMLVQNTLGLLFAELLLDRSAAAPSIRAVVFLPATLSVIVVGFLWTLCSTRDGASIN